MTAGPRIAAGASGMTDRVVMFSGGVGSWATARRVRERWGLDGLQLLFADTLIEDEDVYRFLDEAAADIGAPLERVADGRDPWQVFRDERYIGNTRVDPCSRVLKRELMRRWLDERFDPASTVVYLGIDWSEAHRIERAAPRWAPWTVEAPLCEPPYGSKADLIDELRAAGIEPPRLYAMGFPHANCGGFCVKAGQAQFALLLDSMPDRYREHEAKEEELRQYLDADVSILRDRTGGTTKPLTMRRFREQREAGAACDGFDWGGCGCAVDE